MTRPWVIYLDEYLSAEPGMVGGFGTLQMRPHSRQRYHVLCGS